MKNRMVLNTIKKGFQSCFGRFCTRRARNNKKKNNNLSKLIKINSGKTRRRNNSPTPNTRRVPYRTLPLDKKLNAEDLQYFFDTYAKKPNGTVTGVYPDEYNRLGHFATNASGKLFIWPDKNENRFTLRQMVGYLVHLIRTAKNQITQEIKYSSDYFIDPYTGKTIGNYPVEVRESTIHTFPSFLAYRDAIAAQKGVSSIPHNNLVFKNSEKNLNLYK